jgi:hypothetical protein
MVDYLHRSSCFLFENYPPTQVFAAAAFINILYVVFGQERDTKDPVMIVDRIDNFGMAMVWAVVLQQLHQWSDVRFISILALFLYIPSLFIFFLGVMLGVWTLLVM